MTPTIKFGTLAGLLLFAKTLLPHLIIGMEFDVATFNWVANLLIPAIFIFVGIRAFINSPPPRPVYKYLKGVQIGLGIGALGSIFYVLLFNLWSSINLAKTFTLSSLMSDLLHVFPNCIILALIIPILFFNKKENWSDLDQDQQILDKNL